MPTLVFDTGPLSHFARAHRLDVLRAVVADRAVVIPRPVVEELRRGARLHRDIGAVLEADWIDHRKIQSDAEAEAFGRYAVRLVAGDRNIGEAAVLALAETIHATAVVDDTVAHRLAKRSGVSCTRTLALLVGAVRLGTLTLDDVSDLADSLIATKYRLPFGPGEFARWATEENLFA